jgi:hypothetical protein
VTVIRLPQLDVTRLAADYSAAVRGALTRSQMLNVHAGRAVAADYTDTGELLAEAAYLQRPGIESIADYADELILAEQRASDSGYRLSRILIACEFSGTVRDAMAARGHSVLSCDLKPTEAPGPHYQGDVRDILNDGWHLMIAHPDCTYSTNAGVKHLVRGGQRIDPDRWELMREGAEFFRDLGEADIPQIARENPIMHKYAREIVGRGADQYVQPYHYGHDHSKRTGLWLDNLAPLVDNPADHVEPRIIEYRGKLVKRWANQSPCGADRTPPCADRGHKRSRFFTGIAEAMADQWTGIRRALAPPAPAREVAQLALF